MEIHHFRFFCRCSNGEWHVGNIFKDLFKYIKFIHYYLLMCHYYMLMWFVASIFPIVNSSDVFYFIYIDLGNQLYMWHAYNITSEIDLLTGVLVLYRMFNTILWFWSFRDLNWYILSTIVSVMRVSVIHGTPHRIVKTCATDWNDCAT